ncbi:MAG: hypothetical protein QM820_15975 [Minicystis sp.]
MKAAYRTAVATLKRRLVPREVAWGRIFVSPAVLALIERGEARIRDPRAPW